MKTELQNDSKGGRGAKNQSLHASYIDVHSIRTSNTEYFMSQALGGSG
jgi:DNA helicase MCM8